VAADTSSVGPPPVVPRREAARPQTYGPRSVFALVLSILVIAVAWSCLLAFKHSLSLSSFTVTSEPKKASFDVMRCGADKRYRSGRTDDTGKARVTVPFGCWEARPEKTDKTGFVLQRHTAPSTGGDTTATIVLSALGLVPLVLLYPATQSLRLSRTAQKAHRAGKIVEARIEGDKARQWSAYAFGFAAAAIVISLLIGFLSLANGGLRTPFFNFHLMGSRFGLILRAFSRNVKTFAIAEVFVLVWGLIVAVARLAPGKAGAPVRWLAVGYIDMFRGLPAVIVLFLIDFGFKKSGIPWLSKLDDFWYAVMALTLTYGAYVAEVYRAGIDSIHWSQTAASRSLGLSHTRTLRYVVIPQAVRRIIPPLLNDFIGLQKDTSLIGFIGVVEVVNQARIINSNNFNLSAMTVAAAFFYMITVPQARFVDYLLRRDQARMRAGG
jgi:polar amino acid transport system permease protein